MEYIHIATGTHVSSDTKLSSVLYREIKKTVEEPKKKESKKKSK